MRRIITSMLSIIALLFLSSCSKQKPPFTISYSAFRFDNDISWNSSYSDVVNKYGEPEYNKMTGGYTYHNITVCGYNDFYLSFHFDEETGRLHHILLIQYSKSDSMGKQIYNDVVNGMQSKYGEPEHSVNKEYGWINDKWNYQIEDTSILCDYGKYPTGFNTSILYICSHDNSAEPTYNDLPTTPIPTATPTPRTDGL